MLFWSIYMHCGYECSDQTTSPLKIYFTGRTRFIYLSHLTRLRKLVWSRPSDLSDTAGVKSSERIKPGSSPVWRGDPVLFVKHENGPMTGQDSIKREEVVSRGGRSTYVALAQEPHVLCMKIPVNMESHDVVFSTEDRTRQCDAHVLDQLNWKKVMLRIENRRLLHWFDLKCFIWKGDLKEWLKNEEFLHDMNVQLANAQS